MLFFVCKVKNASAWLALGIATALPACAQLQPAAGQASAATSGAGKQVFDAASVRRSPQEFVLKGVDFLNPASDAAPPEGGLISWNVQLPWLINFAYDLRSSQTRRQAREALPKWAQEDWFSVEARAEGKPSRDDVREMVRSLLEDRFELAVHREKREGQIYALMVAKPGLGLRPHPEGGPCTLSLSEADEKKYPDVNPSYKALPAHCGMFYRELSRSQEHRLEMFDVTMQQIAAALGLGLPLSVVDMTGLAGRYDAVLDYGPDDVAPSAGSADEMGLPPVSVALEKQLGLKLAKRNGPVDALVIDHIEKLSEN